MTEQEQAHIGVVYAFEDGQIVVRFKRQAACEGCKACGMADKSHMEMRLPDPGGFRVGDRVKMDIDTHHYYRSALMLYVLPCAALCIGVAVGYYLFSQVAAALMGLGFAALSYCILHLFEPRFKKQNQTRIHLTKVTVEELHQEVTNG